MEGLTAKLLAPRQPVLIIRTAPTAELKYQVAGTALSSPEGMLISSPNSIRAVAIREEFESTGVAVSLID